MGKYLIFALTAFVLWKMVAGDFKRKVKEKAQPKAEPRGAKSDMVKDPVCGAFVSTSASVRYAGPDGVLRHFCSEECRRAYARQIEVTDASPTKKR